MNARRDKNKNPYNLNKLTQIIIDSISSRNCVTRRIKYKAEPKKIKDLAILAIPK